MSGSDFLSSSLLTLTCYDHSWSRYGRYVLTSSKDWNVIVWDLAGRLTRGTGCLQRMRTIRFDSSVVSASFHPRNRYALSPPGPLLSPSWFEKSKIILVLLSTGELFITDLRMKQTERVELCDTLFRVHQCELHVREREKAREEGEEGEEPSSVPSRGTKRYVNPFVTLYICMCICMWVNWQMLYAIQVSDFSCEIWYFGEICVCRNYEWNVIGVQYKNENGEVFIL